MTIREVADGCPKKTASWQGSEHASRLGPNCPAAGRVGHRLIYGDGGHESSPVVIDYSRFPSGIRVPLT